jgi:hypothetical protein
VRCELTDAVRHEHHRVCGEVPVVCDHLLNIALCGREQASGGSGSRCSVAIVSKVDRGENAAATSLKVEFPARRRRQRRGAKWRRRRRADDTHTHEHASLHTTQTSAPQVYRTASQVTPVPQTWSGWPRRVTSGNDWLRDCDGGQWFGARGSWRALSRAVGG